jgi:hypothetical protein
MTVVVFPTAGRIPHVTASAVYATAAVAFMRVVLIGTPTKVFTSKNDFIG